MNLPDYLISGEQARLIPVSADGNKESKAASILLATLSAVLPYRTVMLASLGQRIGQRTSFGCYTEVCLKKSTTKCRPDGLIQIDSGRGRFWTSLVEAKIKNANIQKDQVEMYVELARENNISAILTISNEFVASPTHSPVHVAKSLLRNVQLYHWSWKFALTQAELLLNDNSIENPEQRYILAEMVRYFSHPSVGISSFDRMNPEWKDLVVKIQSRAVLAKSDSTVENSVAAWHQEVRDLCLLMTRKLNRPVQIRLSKVHMEDQNQRLKDDSRKLVEEHKLSCALEIPDAAAPMDVTADLLTRSVYVSMYLASPKDKQKSTTRLNWLLRQLIKSNSAGIQIKAMWPGRAKDTQDTLQNLRNDPSLIEGENRSLLPTAFEVILVRDLAGRFSGSKTFIEQLEEAVPFFYQQVGQYLKPYIASPPKLKQHEKLPENELDQEDLSESSVESPSESTIDDSLSMAGEEGAVEGADTSGT